MTYSSPSRSARVRSEARSDPASGSLKPWHHRSRPLTIPGRKPCLHVVAPVLEDPLDQVAEARPGRRPGRGQFLVDDDVVHGSAVPGHRCPSGQVRAEEPAVVERAVPRRLAGPVLVVGRRRRQPRVVLLQPLPQTQTERRLLGGVTEVHGHPRSRGGRAPGRGSRPLRRGYRWRAARRRRIDVGQTLPGVADATVDLDRWSRTPCAPPGRSRPWPPRRPPARRPRASASTAQAACRATLRDPSVTT